MWYTLGTHAVSPMAKRRNRSRGRNWHAVNAFLGRDATPFPDEKKESDRAACRGNVEEDEWDDDFDEDLNED